MQSGRASVPVNPDRRPQPLAGGEFLQPKPVFLPVSP